MKYFVTGVVLLLLAMMTASAETTDELMAAVQEEQKAFEDGDCERVESMMSKDVTFYANGRKMSHTQVGRFCRSIPRPFGAGRSPIEDQTTPYAINEGLGYTVRDFKWHDKDERLIHEVVTKIWAKGEAGWKIVHFQSTVVPAKRE